MRTYQGKGLVKMLDCAYRHGLNSDNSVISVKNKGDLDSPWTIRTKE